MFIPKPIFPVLVITKSFELDKVVLDVPNVDPLSTNPAPPVAALPEITAPAVPPPSSNVTLTPIYNPLSPAEFPNVKALLAETQLNACKLPDPPVPNEKLPLVCNAD